MPSQKCTWSIYWWFRLCWALATGYNMHFNVSGILQNLRIILSYYIMTYSWSEAVAICMCVNRYIRTCNNNFHKQTLLQTTSFICFSPWTSKNDYLKYYVIKLIPIGLYYIILCTCVKFCRWSWQNWFCCSHCIRGSGDCMILRIVDRIAT